MNKHDIKRYTVSGDIAYPIHEDPEGDYVTYEDHVAAIEAGRKRWGEYQGPFGYIQPLPYGGADSDDYVTGWNDCCFRIAQEGKRRGEVVVTKTPDGEIIAVTRQDAEGKILSVIAEADRNRRGEPVGYVMPTAIKQLKAGGNATVGGLPQGGDVALYLAPQPAEPVSTHHVYRGAESLPCYCKGKDDHPIGKETLEPVTPRTHFEDARVQKVYEIICGDNHPPFGEHWDGYVSRLIVDALFPAEPVKPYLTVKYDDKGDCLYVCCDSNEPAEAEENEQGVLLRRAFSDGRLVGVTIPNFLGRYAEPVKVPSEAQEIRRLYRAIYKIMERLGEMLNKEQYSVIDRLLTNEGVEPPSTPEPPSSEGPHHRDTGHYGQTAKPLEMPSEDGGET